MGLIHCLQNSSLSVANKERKAANDQLVCSSDAQHLLYLQITSVVHASQN